MLRVGSNIYQTPFKSAVHAAESKAVCGYRLPVLFTRCSFKIWTLCRKIWLSASSWGTRRPGCLGLASLGGLDLPGSQAVVTPLKGIYVLQLIRPGPHHSRQSPWRAVFLGAEVEFSVPRSYQMWIKRALCMCEENQEGAYSSWEWGCPDPWLAHCQLSPGPSEGSLLPTVWRVDPQVNGHWGDAFVGPRDPVSLRFDLLSDFLKVCKLSGLAVQKLGIFWKGKKDAPSEKEKQSCCG